MRNYCYCFADNPHGIYKKSFDETTKMRIVRKTITIKIDFNITDIAP